MIADCVLCILLPNYGSLLLGASDAEDEGFIAVDFDP